MEESTGVMVTTEPKYEEASNLENAGNGDTLLEKIQEDNVLDISGSMDDTQGENPPIRDVI